MGEDYLSDSAPSGSSVSGDLLIKRLTLLNCNPQRHRRNTRNVPKTPTYRVGRKQSLAQCLERQSLFRKNVKMFSDAIGLSPRSKNINKCSAPIKKEFNDVECDWRGAGDHINNRGELNKYYKMNQTNVVFPASAQVPDGNIRSSVPEHHAFPFKNTDSGNFKLDPNQVIYESKYLSIVAADPKNITLNVTDSSKTINTEKKPENENWDTTCLYTTVGKGEDIVFGSDFSETVSESDGGLMFVNGKSAVKPSELNLAKMGYVLDNCIEWKHLKLPMKSELQHLLLHNVLNKTNPDIQVKIGSSVYNCHRIVWQCYCSYFNSKTGPQVELSENSVSKESFSLIYQWMLHLESDSHRLLRRDNILDILKTARFFGIKELENQCFAFIESIEVFSEDKAFLLYMEAKKYNNKEVMGMMVPRVQRFFLTLVSSKEFVEFSCEEVCTFLRSSFICIHCELEVFMAGVRWLMHDWEKRKSDVIEVMKCVRFGLINPKTLVTMRRNPQSPEFLKIANIPEVSKMIDDGVAFTILRSNFENKSDEEFQKSLKSLGLPYPEARNWSGLEKDYHTYQEFLFDLAHYRTKQRLEIKRSKMQVQLEKVNDNDFLSSAVLPPATQQKIKHLHHCASSKQTSPCCKSHLNPKELSFLKKMITQDENVIGPIDNNKQMSAGCPKICCKTHKLSRTITRQQNSSLIRFSSEDQDIAARKIQKAYRGYVENKKSRINMPIENSTTPSYPKPKRLFRSRSDPSVPSRLFRSSTHPPGMFEENGLPLHLDNETVFVFGGSNPFGDSAGSGQNIYKYVAKNNSWKKCSNLPQSLYYHSAVYFQNKIYIAGGKCLSKHGTGNNSVSRQVWRFDPCRKNWSRMKDMAHARRSFCFVIFQRKLFVIGGRDDFDNILDNVEKFDTYSESWVEVRPMNVARTGAAAAVFNERIWVAGGLMSETMPTNSVEYYDSQQNMWVQCSSLRYTMAFSTMIPVQNKLYLIGGAIGLQNTVLTGSGKNIDVWDPKSQTWCLASTMCKPRHAHAAVLVQSESAQPGQIFILGGMLSKHSCVTDQVECWREEDDHWFMGIAPLPHAVCGLAALALPHDIMG